MYFCCFWLNLFSFSMESLFVLLDICFMLLPMMSPHFGIFLLHREIFKQLNNGELLQWRICNKLIVVDTLSSGSACWSGISDVLNNRAGYYQVPRNMILSWYFANDNNNITTFCGHRYIARNFIHDTSRYLCHSRNSEFIDCTTSISQELQNIDNQFHMHDSQVKQSVHWTVAHLNRHTDRNLNIIKYRYLLPVYR